MYRNVIHTRETPCVSFLWITVGKKSGFINVYTENIKTENDLYKNNQFIMIFTLITKSAVLIFIVWAHKLSLLKL